MADSARTFDKRDNTELGYEAVWIPIFAIPAAIAWWFGWTVAMWILAGLTLFAVGAFISAYFQRDDTKWSTAVTFAHSPLPLGGPTMLTVALDAIQIGRDGKGDPTGTGRVAVEVTLTCEERFEKKVPSNTSDHGYRRGEFETEVVLDRTESFTSHLAGGQAAIEIPFTIPVDRGAPTQRTKAPPLTYEVIWNARIHLPELNRTIFDDEIPVAPVWSPPGVASHD